MAPARRATNPRETPLRVRHLKPANPSHPDRPTGQRRNRGLSAEHLRRTRRRALGLEHAPAPTGVQVRGYKPSRLRMGIIATSAGLSPRAVAEKDAAFGDAASRLAAMELGPPAD